MQTFYKQLYSRNIQLHIFNSICSSFSVTRRYNDLLSCKVLLNPSRGNDKVTVNLTPASTNTRMR